MYQLNNSSNIFFWLQLLVVSVGVIYCFTFNTFHLHQASFSAKFLNLKLPFVNGLFLYVTLFAGVCFSITNQMLNKKYYKITWLDGLFIAYILYHFISFFWVKDYGLGLAALSVTTSFYVFYFLINDLLKQNKHFTIKWIKHLICILSAAFVLHFFISNFDVLLNFINTDHSFQKIITQSKSWVGGKNQTACFLALLLPLVILLKPQKWILLFLVSIILIQLLIMGSRNAYIAVIVLLVIYLLFNKIELKQVAKAVLVLLVVLFIFVNFVGFEVLINQLKSNTWASRFVFWQQTLQMGLDYGLLGVGAGQWDAYRLQYDVWYTYKHPHNDFVRSFAELGLVGFLLFYSIIASALFSIFKNLKHHKKPAVIAICAIAVYLSLSFFDELKMKDNYNILLALIFALINYKLPTFKLPQVHSKFMCLGLFIFLFLGALFVTIYPIKIQNEMQHFKKYSIFLKEKETELAVNELKKINQNLLGSIDRKPVYILISDAYFNARNMDSAVLYYAKAAKKKPYYINNFIGGLRVNLVRNKKLGAWKQLSKIYMLNPCNIVLKNYQLEMPSFKTAKYYQNIIQKQKAKCDKLLEDE